MVEPATLGGITALYRGPYRALSCTAIGMSDARKLDDLVFHLRRMCMPGKPNAKPKHTASQAERCLRTESSTISTLSAPHLG